MYKSHLTFWVIFWYKKCDLYSNKYGKLSGRQFNNFLEILAAISDHYNVCYAFQEQKQIVNIFTVILEILCFRLMIS